MDRFLSQQSSASSVVRLAERLLAEAEACPALTFRSNPAVVASAPPSGHFPALALLSDPVLDVRPYLEHLTAMAAAAAQRSEALAQLARQRRRKMQRQILAIGALGTVAFLIGVSGVVASRNANRTIAELRGQLSALTEQQRLAQIEITATLAARKDEAQAAEATAQPRRTAATQVAAEPALQAPDIRYSAQPWPDSRPLQRHNTVAPRRQPTGSHFLAGFERNIPPVLR